MSQYYLDNAQLSMEEFLSYSEERKNLLAEAIGDVKIERVLDVGCGAGQQLLPFAKKGALCFGLDIAKEVVSVGSLTFQKENLANKAIFVPAEGEYIPFADNSFDVVLCRLSLPYMDNRAALAEISRVLRPGGSFFLKTHHPMFYWKMIKERFPTLNPKMLAYPIICIVGGVLNLTTGKHPRGRLWRDKEVFQTDMFLEREFKKNGFKLIKMMPDSCRETKSYLLEKI